MPRQPAFGLGHQLSTSAAMASQALHMVSPPLCCYWSHADAGRIICTHAQHRDRVHGTLSQGQMVQTAGLISVMDACRSWDCPSCRSCLEVPHRQLELLGWGQTEHLESPYTGMPLAICCTASCHLLYSLQ